MRVTAEFLAFLTLAGERATAQSNSRGPISAAPEACPESPCSASASAVPDCAVGCIRSAATAISCATDDYACQCSSSSAMQDAGQDCVLDSCGLATALAAGSSLRSLCDCVTASPTTPCTEAPSATATVTAAGGSDVATLDIRSAPAASSSSTPSASDPGPPSMTVCAVGLADCGAIASTVIPACAQPCVAGAATSVGCGADDFACQCQPVAQSSLSSLVAPCVVSACPPDSLDAVLSAGSTVCACATGSPDSAGLCSAPAATPTGDYVPGTMASSNDSASTGGGPASAPSSDRRVIQPTGGMGFGGEKAMERSMVTGGANGGFEIGVLGSIAGAVLVGALAL